MKLLSLICILAVSAISSGATKTVVVASDGTGDFTTINDAIAAVPENSVDRSLLHIKAGRYAGQTFIPKNKSGITFEGEGVDKTFLYYAYNQNEPNPGAVDRQYRGVGVVVLGDGFEASDLTFENISGDHGQAIALRIDGDRAVVTHCHVVGWQDTLMLNSGRQYFRDDYISGRVDFIYGSGTSVFDHCEIHSRNGGHITAASTPQDHPYGFVFLDCNLTADKIPWDPATTNPTTTVKPKVTPLTDLGRPWRPFASVSYIRCDMGSHIRPQGWNNWGKTSNEQTARYSEYHSTGPGANAGARFAWTRQLPDQEAAQMTVSHILAGDDSWNPAAHLSTTAP